MSVGLVEWQKTKVDHEVFELRIIELFQLLMVMVVALGWLFTVLFLI
jgi:hypothetical protein